jgi:N utilization substance protein A
MFEKEIPEVYDGTVEIVSIAREAGDRAKVIVKSNDANVDAIGTIVGPRGSRIRTLVDELHGENMDIIEWHDDRATLIKKCLVLRQVTDVIINEETGETVVVVPDDQLSLAIGKRGQSVWRLTLPIIKFTLSLKQSLIKKLQKLFLKKLKQILLDEVLD